MLLNLSIIVSFLCCKASAFNVALPQTQTTSISSTTSLFSQNAQDEANAAGVTSRRNVLNGVFASLFVAGSSMTVFPEQSTAFDNKISNKYDDRPKRKGPQPKDLGVSVRKDMVGEEYVGLKPCGPAPNCFCTTDSIEDDPEHNIPAWKYPESLDKEGAFLALEKTVKAYTPGQGNIDGGGFQIVKSDPKKGYFYAQFEALKNGYIDDLEFASIDGLGDRMIQVRSSSRVGYLDFGVNAKRLNYIAKALKAEGWEAIGVDAATHGDYVAQNGR
jgi:uncharacterized protein (DUF1499 family)